MCLLCETKTENQNILDTSCFVVKCPNCGFYGVTDDFDLEARNFTPEIKTKLSHLLAEHYEAKRPPVILAISEGGNIVNFLWTPYKEFLKKYPFEASEIMDRSLLNLSRKIKHPSEPIRIDDRIKNLFFTNDIMGVLYIIRQLAGQNFVTSITSTPNDIYIEAKGWQKIAELKKRPEGLLNQAFVAMWFDPTMELFFKEGIEKAILDSTNYKVMRIDLLEHNNKICDQIIAEINKSKLVIADFSGQRGGVYFEAGYAQGRGIPVIWTVQENEIDKLHFDTRQYNHIVYKTEMELYKKLKARIEATIKI